MAGDDREKGPCDRGCAKPKNLGAPEATRGEGRPSRGAKRLYETLTALAF